jgi:uncharacterized protein YjiS (DUF1127 family)
VVLGSDEQISAHRQLQTHDPLRLGRGRSRALEFDDDIFSPGPAGIGRGLLFGPRSLPARQQEHPMPTQQTNLTSETERDAAVLGLELSIALVKEAMDDTLAAARPNASIAAPDDALSEKDAAGLTVASTRSVLSLLKQYWRAFQERRQRQSLRATLHDLSDRELMDVGVTRGEIDYIARHRAIDTLRDSTTYLWILSRGEM